MQQPLKETPVGLLKEMMGKLMPATWTAASGTYRHTCDPLLNDQECKMFCKLQPFCVKHTHQVLTDTNVSNSFLF